MSDKTNPMDVRTDFDRYKERHQKTPTEPIRSTSLKAIIIGACVLVVAALIVIPIIISATRTRHLALPEKINKITIYKEGTAGTTFSYTNKEKIDALVEYFNSLMLKATTRTPNGPEELYSGGWQISIISSEEKYGLNLVGNKYIQSTDGKWYIISEEQAMEFEKLLKAHIPDELPDGLLFDEWR